MLGLVNIRARACFGSSVIGLGHAMDIMSASASVLLHGSTDVCYSH
jgi:hypothetical protein